MENKISNVPESRHLHLLIISLPAGIFLAEVVSVILLLLGWGL